MKYLYYKVFYNNLEINLRITNIEMVDRLLLIIVGMTSHTQLHTLFDMYPTLNKYSPPWMLLVLLALCLEKILFTNLFSPFQDVLLEEQKEFNSSER